MLHGERRDHFRIIYPQRVRPRLSAGHQTYEVVDLSEGGLRLAPAAGAPVPSVGDELTGALRFRRDGETVLIRGTVVRVEPNHIALQLAVGLGYKLVVAEQRFVVEASGGATG
jgi:hypothetical protein